MTKEKILKLDLFRCKGCGICVEFCPRGVLKLVSDKVSIASPELCIGCGFCEKLCPDYALYLEAKEEK